MIKQSAKNSFTADILGDTKTPTSLMELPWKGLKYLQKSNIYWLWSIFVTDIKAPRNNTYEDTQIQARKQFESSARKCCV